MVSCIRQKNTQSSTITDNNYKCNAQYNFFSRTGPFRPKLENWKHVIPLWQKQLSPKRDEHFQEANTRINLMYEGTCKKKKKYHHTAAITDADKLCMKYTQKH